MYMYKCVENVHIYVCVHINIQYCTDRDIIHYSILVHMI